MRNLFLSIGVMIAFIATVNGQAISENAIGLRLGSNNGFGAEISYQRKLSDVSRLEVDLGLRGDNSYSAFKASGLYQWVWQLEDKFNWYAGAGGGIGSWKVKSTDDSEAFVFAAGIIGIEYHFDIPLLISLDFRPEIGFNSNIYSGLNSDFGLGVRYQF
ncbi:hypothetical protein [Tenacibaculum maritimum]|uniref:hypothetical protein n=1 Tax=Tenacibaculum maritimum TaxID=107401 RepID=UPI002306F16F|nr:hypothetical protein [Tenacibaculum maritimum]MDB0601649.1 hypothetical protein [Tenacibaculum maritimum]MDB0612829.1 hypothetical protein [Tenacibaculum maritimum]